MQNVRVVSRPEFHVISNGALVFWCKANIMHRKIDTAIHRNLA
jgi:hypothetical protein